MDILLALKPLVTALVLPAVSLSLLLAVSLIWSWLRIDAKSGTSPRVPIMCAGAASVLLWLCSCSAVSVGLAKHLLPAVEAIQVDDLKRSQIQAIVVLGGGIHNQVDEYGGPTLVPEAMSRLLYGAYLARASHLPMAFSGGKGWAAPQAQHTEAQVADLALARLGIPALRWQENQSRDTHENARQTAAMLHGEGITRIALVTHAWHMPRSVKHFEAAGFTVLPAPMGFMHSGPASWQLWLPSGSGLRDTGLVLKEWLALRLI